MKRSTELLQKKAEIMDKMKALTEAGKIDEAHALIADKAQVEKEIDLALAMENEDKTPINAEPAGQVIDQTKLANRAFNKAILGRRLTEDEAKLVVEDVAGTPGQVGATPEKGGYLLREDQAKHIYELKRALKPWSIYCGQYKTKARSGSFPVDNDKNDELINFDELNEINVSDIDFSKITYETKDYGDIIPISNTLLNDIDVDLVAHIEKRFVKKSARTEHKKVIEELLKISPKTGTTVKDITAILNKALDPALLDGTAIYTNQSGYDFFDNLEDKNGRPLLSENLADKTSKLFKGLYPVRVTTDAKLPLQGGAIPFFIGNMEEFLKFIDRQQIAIAMSTEAGFTKNATYLRAIERFDLQKVDTEAMTYLKLTPAKTV